MYQRGFRYHVFAMYAPHQGGRLLRHSLQCESYTFGEGSIPALNVSVSKGSDGAITVSFCNNNPREPQSVACQVRGGELAAAAGSVLKADSMNAHNAFSAPEVVKPQPFTGFSRSRERSKSSFRRCRWSL